jgi:hypothetical protein
MTTKPQLNLQPSSASCWTVCTAQPAFIRDHQHLIPADLDTKYSIEGDQAHAATESLLMEGSVPFGTSAEMARHAQSYRDYVRSLRDPITGEVHVERRVPLFYMPGRNGRVDTEVRNWGEDGCMEELHIVDLKYGAGIKVHAEGNKQTSIYGRSAVEDRRIKDPLSIHDGTMVHMHIVQPRNGGTSVWSATWDALKKWTDKYIGEPAHLILSGGETKFSPSDETCRFCPGAGFCAARRNQLLSGFDVLEAPLVRHAGPVDLPPKQFLTEHELITIKTKGKDIVKWIGDVLEYLDQQAAAGKPLKGFKLVDGKGQRYWLDEDRVEKLLRQKLTADEVRPSKLISPAQAEELLEGHELSTKFQNLFNSLIGKNHGSKQLVPEDDPRAWYGEKLVAGLPVAAPDDNDCPV